MRDLRQLHVDLLGQNCDRVSAKTRDHHRAEICNKIKISLRTEIMAGILGTLNPKAPESNEKEFLDSLLPLKCDHVNIALSETKYR